jgi:pimeloyl-ACP methyl ester carboxylesterase
MTTDPTAVPTATGAYADINGVHYYYETHGAGRPLVLLHGGVMHGGMFAPVMDLYAADHQVITVDLQGHGRTADIDRPIDLAAMGADIAALIEHLGLDRPDLMGYSLGGGVAFQAAVQRPDLIRRLVLVSAYMWRTAIYPEMLVQQGQVTEEAVDGLKGTPMYQEYVRIAPNPDDFGRLLGKIGAFMAQDFDATDQVRGLQVPTLIAAADADMAPPSHYVEVFGLLDGGKRDGGWMGEGRPKGGHALAILPGLTHYDVGASPLLARAALAFLDAPEG